MIGNKAINRGEKKMFGLGNRSPTGGRKPFKRIYNLTDFGVTADVVCQPSQWNRVGTVTVPAQQMITFGADDPTGGSSRAGSPCYIKFDDAADAQLHGKVRLSISDANELNEVVVIEERTARLSADVSDRTKAVLLPEYTRAYAKEDSKLHIKFYPDSSSAVTIDYNGTETDASIPVTVYQ
jgi:hypothetical protein